MKKLILIIFIATSCASLMSEKDCQVANWKNLGHQDSSGGATPDYFLKRQEICTEHGITANHKQYKRGYRTGLKKYCTYTNGVSVGENDNNYHNICPRKLERDFLRGFELGKKNLEIEQLLQKKNRTYYSRKKCFSSFDCEIESKCKKRQCTHTGKNCFSDFDCDDFEAGCNNRRCVYVDQD